MIDLTLRNAHTISSWFIRRWHIPCRRCVNRVPTSGSSATFFPYTLKEHHQQGVKKMFYQHLQGQKIQLVVLYEKMIKCVPQCTHGYQLAAFLETYDVESPEIKPSQP